MTVLKSKKVPKQPKSVTKFTRAEFQLLESLVEDEATADLARTNSRYAATLSDLLHRLVAVGSPDAEHWPTDIVSVS